jgi:Holliday junction resolvase-like predicted endonuclease
MSEQRKIAVALEKVMQPGVKYTIDELINLLTLSDYIFSTEARTPSRSESHRPRWNRWVRNAVRGAEGRTGNSDWWPRLRAEFSEINGSVWLYWIEIAEETDDAFSLETGVVTEPINNNGWMAERVTQRWLENHGFEVYDVSREKCGFDLLARRNGRELFIEVKSSISSLKIVLTEKEWIVAQNNLEKYKIAYFDNFSPDKEQEPKWIENVGDVTAIERKISEYYIPKEHWHQ